MLKKALLLIVVVLLARAASAQMGSVKTAMFIVDFFFDETLYMMRNLERDEKLREVTEEMRKRKDAAISTLRTIRMIEAPGKERFTKIYLIVEAYLGAQIKSFNGLKESHDARGIELMVRELQDIKKAKLKALQETKKYETYRGEQPRPVPLIDKSPFESGGKTGSGGEIWFR